MHRKQHRIGVLKPRKGESYCPNILCGREFKHIVIPDGVLYIGRSAFSLQKIESVKIPDGVEVIERGAFFDNRLTSLKLPSSVRVIEDGAFRNNKLESVEMIGSPPKNYRQAGI